MTLPSAPKMPITASRFIQSGRGIKERLFDRFHMAVSATFVALECQFDVVGLVSQVLGDSVDPPPPSIESAESLRRNGAWRTLSVLYDYAVEGLDHGEHPNDIVIGGADVLKLATSENHDPGDEWESIVAMADGRFALDSGERMDPYKLALLARVDLRTVRNAMSAGDLEAAKDADGISVENTSARRWLLGRKGFRPTVAQDGPAGRGLASVDTPAGFAAFLEAQATRLGDTPEASAQRARQAGVNMADVERVELGLFDLPISAATALADYYQLGRKQFLDCVMRVFFAREMELLKGGRNEPV